MAEAAPRTNAGWILAGIALAGLALYSFLEPMPDRSSAPTMGGEAPGKEPEAAGGGKMSGQDDGSRTVDLAGVLDEALVNFRTALEPEEARALLANLRDTVRRAPEGKAAAALVDFLRRGGDAPTGLPFSVGADGVMDGVPTLRLALLDLLPSLDPTAALELARELMAGKASQDEYALCLRNVAWNDLDGDMRQELSTRFLEMLQMPWIKDPSAGFLEAFDVAVEVGGKPMFDRLVTVARDAEQRSDDDLARAAYMSLDRMVTRDPGLVRGSLEKDAAWMDFAPMQRASLVSRLDITDAAQLGLFTKYLTSPRAAGELEYFAGLYPNRNYLHGNRLVTADEATPGLPEVVADDAKVAGILKTMDLSGNPAAKGAVEKILGRIDGEAGK